MVIIILLLFFYGGRGCIRRTERTLTGYRRTNMPQTYDQVVYSQPSFDPPSSYQPSYGSSRTLPSTQPSRWVFTPWLQIHGVSYTTGIVLYHLPLCRLRFEPFVQLYNVKRIKRIKSTSQNFHTKSSKRRRTSFQINYQKRRQGIWRRTGSQVKSILQVS